MDQGSSKLRVEDAVLAGDERWDLILRILASKHFNKAHHLAGFLRYVSRRSLFEGATEITEREIGCEALGRKPDYDPAGDNIVRVQARHLRERVADYFASEGRDEPIEVVIPKGTYVPQFHRRQIPAVTPPPEPGSRHLSLKILAAAAAALSVLLASVVLLLVWQRLVDVPDPFWSDFFIKGRQTNIVLADTSLVVLQGVLHSDISLEEYASSSYPARLLASIPNLELRAALEDLATRRYTSFGDANVASRIFGLTKQHGATGLIRYARHLNSREFKGANFVLIGSRRGIPWVRLFESQLNFSFERETTGSYFRNKAPRPGERATYVPAVQRSGQESYVTIAFLPNLDNTGNVLILNGLTMEANEAAGELVSSPGFGGKLQKLLGTNQRPFPPFEILIKASVVGGGSMTSEILAFRIGTPQRREH